MQFKLTKLSQILWKIYIDACIQMKLGCSKSGEHIEDYEYEGLKNNLIKNNIYRKVSRIEPSLQAAFVDFVERDMIYLLTIFNQTIIKYLKVIYKK